MRKASCIKPYLVDFTYIECPEKIVWDRWHISVCLGLRRRKYLFYFIYCIQSFVNEKDKDLNTRERCIGKIWEDPDIILTYITWNIVICGCPFLSWISQLSLKMFLEALIVGLLAMFFEVVRLISYGSKLILSYYWVNIFSITNSLILIYLINSN